MTLRGTLLVARQEFRVRLRTSRWQWLLVAWVVVFGGFAALVWLDLARTGTPARQRGNQLFGALVLFLLTLVLLVTPALTAHSVNGDRERGTLATLQVTQLSAGDIAVGKLLSAWLTVLAALALTLPFVAWSVLAGGVGADRAARTIAVIAAAAAVLCAVAQMLSALVDRTIASALLSYVVVFALTFGTLIIFGLALGFSSRGHGQARRGPRLVGARAQPLRHRRRRRTCRARAAGGSRRAGHGPPAGHGDWPWPVRRPWQRRMRRSAHRKQGRRGRAACSGCLLAGRFTARRRHPHRPRPTRPTRSTPSATPCAPRAGDRGAGSLAPYGRTASPSTPRSEPARSGSRSCG